MREYDDHIRLYTPVLQRIIILVAVIIAVPVVLWTITAFVRTYVAPPELPTFQRMTTLTQPSDNAATAAAQSNPAPAQAPLTDSFAPPAGTTGTAQQQSSNPPQTAAPQIAPQVASQDALATTAQPSASATPVQPAATQAVSASATAAPLTPPAAPSGAAQDSADKADRMAAPPASGNSFAWPNPPTIPAGNTNVGVATGATPASTDASADLLPPADPITGRIPLPPRRPRVFAMAQMGGVPMPRPRPQSAGSATASTSDTDGPLGWLHNIFQPQNPTQDSSQNP
jgi:hypothetical protein